MHVNNNNDKKTVDHKGHGQSGFSILEMLMSLIIFSVVIAAVYGLLQVASAGRNMSSERSDLMKQMRYTLNLMGRDALNAGYSYDDGGGVVPDNLLFTRLGIPADTNTSRDYLMGVVAGNNVNTNSLQEGTTQKTDLVSFIYRDLTFNPDPVTGSSRTMTLTTAAANPTDVPLITAATGSDILNKCRKNDLYLIQTETAGVVVLATELVSATTIRFKSGDPLAINQTYTNGTLKPCGSTNCLTYPASMARVIWVAFSVKSDGTLVRMVYGNNGTDDAQQIQEQPLAYGIENLQIKYVMKDGSVTDDPAAGPDNISGNTDDVPLNLNQVRQIRFTITARGNDVDPRTGKRNQITMTSTFSTRNMGYNAG
jgi:prepilin-type N-terminal cleavage/methylation domain-containing protein